MARKRKGDGPVCPIHGVDLTNFNCGNCLIEKQKIERDERKRKQRERQEREKRRK